MKNFIISIFVIVLAFGLAMSVKAESRYWAEPITIVANTANRVLTKLIVGAATNSVTGFKIYFSNQGNTWVARTDVKLVLDILPKTEGEYLNLPRTIDIVTILNSATNFGIFFDTAMRVEVVGNTPNITGFMKYSSSE